jgi:hypothetical protein
MSALAALAEVAPGILAWKPFLQPAPGVEKWWWLLVIPTAVGVALAGTGFLLGGRRVQRTRYRPDPWRSPEWGVAMCGAVVAVAMVAIGHSDPAALDATLDPLTWPALPLTAAAAVLVGVLPAWLAPPTMRSAPPGRLANKTWSCYV